MYELCEWQIWTEGMNTDNYDMIEMKERSIMQNQPHISGIR